MKLSAAIKKCEKLSGAKIQKGEKQRYHVLYKGHEIHFFVNGKLDENGEGEITCIHSRRIGAKDDPESDYFAGTFHDNIAQAFRFVDNFWGKQSNVYH